MHRHESGIGLIIYLLSRMKISVFPNFKRGSWNSREIQIYEAWAGAQTWFQINFFKKIKALLKAIISLLFLDLWPILMITVTALISKNSFSPVVPLSMLTKCLITEVDKEHKYISPISTSFWQFYCFQFTTGHFSDYHVAGIMVRNSVMEIHSSILMCWLAAARGQGEIRCPHRLMTGWLKYLSCAVNWPLFFNGSLISTSLDSGLIPWNSQGPNWQPFVQTKGLKTLWPH